jgi:endonuclease/exonuclease/phosphatase family metal-dependent hydrolase
VPVRIATFNLESLGDSREPTVALGRRLDRLRTHLLRLDADVLCLQEVNARKAPRRHRVLAALDRLLDGTPYAGSARVEMTRMDTGAPADRHNLVIVSRLPIAESRQIWNDIVPPLSYRPVTGANDATPIINRFDRPFLYAALSLSDGRRLHIVNVHLRAPIAAPIAGQKQSALVWRSVGAWAEGFFLAALRRSAQALEVRLFVERLFDQEPDALIAVCGDFNADAPEVPVRLIQAPVEDTGNPALDGRELCAIERRIPDQQRYSVLHAGAHKMLDHILVSKALMGALCGAQVDNQGLADEVFDAAPQRSISESFHAAVAADFALTR